MYDIHELAEKKTELEKLFVVPNAVRGDVGYADFNSNSRTAQ